MRPDLFGNEGRDAYHFFAIDPPEITDAQDAELVITLFNEDRSYNQNSPILQEERVDALRYPNGLFALKEPAYFWPKQHSISGNFFIEVTHEGKIVQAGKNHYNEFTYCDALETFGDIYRLTYINPQ